jgi:hypothetical protein
MSNDNANYMDNKECFLSLKQIFHTLLRPLTKTSNKMLLTHTSHTLFSPLTKTSNKMLLSHTSHTLFSSLTQISYTILKRDTKGWKVRGSNPSGGAIFRACLSWPWGPLILPYNVYRFSFRGYSDRSVPLTVHHNI